MRTGHDARRNSLGPLFSGQSVETSGGKMAVTIKNEFNIPNWFPQDAAGIRALADAIQSEQERRGVRSF